MATTGGYGDRTDRALLKTTLNSLLVLGGGGSPGGAPGVPLLPAGNSRAGRRRRCGAARWAQGGVGHLQLPRAKSYRVKNQCGTIIMFS